MTERSYAEEQMARWMQEAGLPVHHSIAHRIYDFAKGDSSGELACAYAYAALCGFPVPLGHLMNGDFKRKAWVIRGLMEVATDEWQGSPGELDDVLRRHPIIRKKAEAAQKAWEA